MKRQQWVAVMLTVALIVLLYFAPRHSGDAVSSADTLTKAGNPPTVENRIDSALSIIASEAPMQGILLLREIAEENPSNFRAQYHLGRFSAQTAQWDKVVERFERVKSIDPDFTESNYWLGKAKFNLGQLAEAGPLLQSFLSEEKENHELRTDAQTMLNQINN